MQLADEPFLVGNLHTCCVGALDVPLRLDSLGWVFACLPFLKKEMHSHY